MNTKIQKKPCFVDFDGTAVDTVEAIIAMYNDDFQLYKKFTPLKVEDIDSWGFTECICASTEYIDTYFNTPRFFRLLKLMPHAQTVLYELKKRYDVKIVSMGFSPNLLAKEQWLKLYLPGIEFIGVNYKSYADKSHINMSGGILIDDSEKNLRTSNAEAKYCFGNIHSWNKEWEGKRLVDWTDVANQLL